MTSVTQSVPDLGLPKAPSALRVPNQAPRSTEASTHCPVPPTGRYHLPCHVVRSI